MMPRRVSVVGAGVVGLSIAHEFAQAGDTVTVVSDRPAEDSVSAVAAAIWFPYRSGAAPALTTWLIRARARFEQLAADESTGVDLRLGTVVERSPEPDRSWTAALPDYREATAAELPPGAAAGVRARVPIISMPHYLPWLRKRCDDLGVQFVGGAVTAI